MNVQELLSCLRPQCVKSFDAALLFSQTIFHVRVCVRERDFTFVCICVTLMALGL